MNRIVEGVYRRISRLLPARIAASVDWHVFPNPARPYKERGPFNGQNGRVRAFTKILDSLPIEAIVETGTFRGTTTLFLRHASGLPVYTVEASPRNFYFARRRFRYEDDIHLQCGDSRSFLKRLGQDPDVAKGTVFFYLDAHWGGELPLREELEIVAKYWREPIIMIDDFQVLDDPGYAFDDFGPDRRLAVSYLTDAFLREFRLFWPSIRAIDETGHRRGSVIAARRGPTADKLATLPQLRENEAVYSA